MNHTVLAKAVELYEQEGCTCLFRWLALMLWGVRP
jgi:hypothetical protein